MGKLNGDNRKVQNAVNGLSKKLQKAVGNVMKTVPQNVETIGRRWAVKNVEIMTAYGCDNTCVDDCAGSNGRNWANMETCIASRRGTCDCPGVVAINSWFGSASMSPYGVNVGPSGAYPQPVAPSSTD